MGAMISNCTVEIISGTTSTNGWEDIVITEGVPTSVPGHIGQDVALTGRDVTDKDGLTSRRARVRLLSDVVVPADSVFRINGVRWRPVASKRARSPQLHTIYECQQIT